MARTHIVSPLPEDYLRELAGFFHAVSDGYNAAAESLKASGMPTVHVEKFASLVEGMARVRAHFDQVVDSVRRLDVENRFDILRDEPLPHARYDATRGVFSDIELAVQAQAEKNGWARGNFRDADEFIRDTIRQYTDRGDLIVIPSSESLRQPSKGRRSKQGLTPDESIDPLATEAGEASIAETKKRKAARKKSR